MRWEELSVHLKAVQWDGRTAEPWELQKGGLRVGLMAPPTAATRAARLAGSSDVASVAMTALLTVDQRAIPWAVSMAR